MGLNTPVKVWCSKAKDSEDGSSFYLYSRVEGEDVGGVLQMIEATVQAVASQYFGTGVVFERCVRPANLNSFDKLKVTEVPLLGTEVSPEAKHYLKQKHLALNYGLSPQQLDCVFPFHLVFDSSLNIVQSGELCLQHIPSAIIGVKVTDIFDVHNRDQKSLA